jgi:hypothetical protein
MATDPGEVRAQVPRFIRHAVTGLSLVGLAGLLLTLLFGFEEPNAILLWPCSATALAAPVVVVIHLAYTETLAADKKRAWWTSFAGANVFSAVSEYLSSPDLAASAERRAIERERRSRLTNT